MGEIEERFKKVREESLIIAKPLSDEDCVVQPVEYVSPIKWHLAHTTWFYETFILKTFSDYVVYNDEYAYLFNSYYETEGLRLIRANRGNLTRPRFNEILAYRTYVDKQVLLYMNVLNIEQLKLLELGLNHEQQHQELMWYDLKYVLGHNPIFPRYAATNPLINNNNGENSVQEWISFEKQIVSIGHKNKDFCYDNELGEHEVLIQNFSVQRDLVSNGEYLEFINAKAYSNFNFWLSEGWDWVNKNTITAPEYWYKKGEQWMEYDLDGLKSINFEKPVKHISFFEADAYARWKGCRLLTEFEWELASTKISYGALWEWTQSAYLPYPGFEIATGAVGEYNGKFMVNQKVLRGGSVASPVNHIRPTYRNFFHPQLRWMYSGIRLAK